MTSRYKIYYGCSIICIILVSLLCISPINAAEMTNEQITKELSNFFSYNEISSPSSDELRTIGILFLMTADIKEAAESESYEKIAVILHPKTYACVGADAQKDYLSQFLTFMGLLESDDNQSFIDLNLYDILVALAMAKESTITPKPTSSEFADLSIDPFTTDIDPDAMIKTGLKDLLGLGSEFTGNTYSGGMRPGIY